jgi:uncharacterized protein with HEPN domain
MRDDRLYLEEMVAAAESIAVFLDGVARERFLVDDLIQSAVILKLTIIGEATAQLSNGLKSRHPSIPWQKIKAFRNQAIHAYFALDWEIVWGAATVNVPILLQELRRIIGDKDEALNPTS